MELRKYRGSMWASGLTAVTYLTIGGLGAAEPARAAPLPASTINAVATTSAGISTSLSNGAVQPMSSCHFHFLCGRIYYTKTGSKYKTYKLLIAENWPSTQPRARLASHHYSTKYWRDTDAYYATKTRGCNTYLYFGGDPPQPAHWSRVRPGWHKMGDILGYNRISVNCS